MAPFNAAVDEKLGPEAKRGPGAPPKVSDAAIIAAGKKLLADGKRVNASSLHNVLAQGGYARLQRVWDNYVAQQNAAEQTVQPPPDDLPARIVEQRDVMRAQVLAVVDAMSVSAWRVADELAQQRTKLEHEDAQRRIADAEEIKALDAMNIDAVVAELEGVEEELALASLDLAAARTEATRLNERLVAMHEEARRAAEATSSTIADLTARLAAAERETADQRVDAAASGAAAAAAEADALRNRDALSDVRAKLAASLADLEVARTTTADLGAKLKTAEARAESVTDDLARERHARERADAGLTEKLTVAAERAARAEATLAARRDKRPTETKAKRAAGPQPA